MNCPHCGGHVAVNGPALEGKRRVKQRRIDNLELVSNAPFREWFAAHGTSKLGTKICRYMKVYGFRHYMRTKTDGAGATSYTADTTYLKRQLGLMRRSNSRGFKDVLPYDEAVALARAMGLDPVEVGV